MRLAIQSASSLPTLRDHSVRADEIDVLVEGARIACVSPAGQSPKKELTDCDDSLAVFDARGLLLLPGIVDIHGDAFERQIQPRPEVVFDHEIAIADTDRQLVANGITTACHGLTFSWEGGLRGRESALALLRQLARDKSIYQTDHRVHLRFENHHIGGLQDALDWIAQGWISFFAFNEHLPSIARKCERPEKLAAYAERARCDAASFRQRLEAAQSQSGEVSRVIESLAAECRRRGVPMASHDDETQEDRLRYHAMEVGISEFPRSKEALDMAMELDNKVIMGAPNVLLGGSHCGGLSAAEAVRKGKCHVLASDYYYPSLLLAPFRLAYGEKACSLAQAWDLVSNNPANALGLRDRGRIAAGCRADLLLVESLPSGTPRLIATIAAGRLVYCAQPERLSSPQRTALAA